MGQTRLFNYKEDDLTWLLNLKNFGIIPSGRYAGFDMVDMPNSNLRLNGSLTGYQVTEQDQTITDQISLAISRQGVEVRITGNIDLPITIPSTGDFRWDLVVMEHEYVSTIGGIGAVFSVIQGTLNSATKPTVLYPEKQVPIGYLYVNGGAASISQVEGCYWTAERVPIFGGGVDNFARLNEKQIFTALQTFSAIGYVKGSGNILPPRLEAENGQYIEASDSNTSFSEIVDTSGLENKVMYIKFLGNNVTITQSTAENGVLTPNEQPLVLQKGDGVLVAKFGDNWYIIQVVREGSRVQYQQVADPWGSRSFDLNATLVSFTSSGYVDELTECPEGTVKTFKFDQDFNAMIGFMVFEQNNSPASSGYLRIKTPRSTFLALLRGDYVTMVVRDGYWEVMSVNRLSDGCTSIATLAVDGSFSVNSEKLGNLSTF